MHKCPVCKTKIKSDKKEFCSAECAKYVHGDRGYLEDKTCPICEDEFHPSHRRQRFCSRECKGIYMSKKAYRRRIKSGDYRVCPECNTKHFNKVYCSDECAKKVLIRKSIKKK